MTTALAVRKERALLRQERALARGPTPVPSPGRPPTIDIGPLPPNPTQPPALSYSGGDSLIGIAGAAASIPSSMLQGVGATAVAGLANWANTPLVDFGGAFPWEMGRGKKRRTGEIEAVVHLNNGHIIAAGLIYAYLNGMRFPDLGLGLGGAGADAVFGGAGNPPIWMLLINPAIYGSLMAAWGQRMRAQQEMARGAVRGEDATDPYGRTDAYERVGGSKKRAVQESRG